MTLDCDLIILKGLTRRSSSVGQSSGIIIHVSGVRVPPPLLILIPNRQASREVSTCSGFSLSFCIYRCVIPVQTGIQTTQPYLILPLKSVTPLTHFYLTFLQSPHLHYSTPWFKLSHHLHLHGGISCLCLSMYYSQSLSWC